MWIPPEEIGALTDSPIISRDAVLEDDGTYRIYPGGELFWHANYMVEDLLKKWANGEPVIWHASKQPKIEPSGRHKKRARALNAAKEYRSGDLKPGDRLRTQEEMVFIIDRDSVVIPSGTPGIFVCESYGSPVIYFPEIDMSWHHDADEHTAEQWCGAGSAVPDDAFVFAVPGRDIYSDEEIEDDGALGAVQNFWQKFRRAIASDRDAPRATGAERPRSRESRKSRARKLNKGKIRIDRKGYCVEPTTYERDGRTIERSAYCVEPSSFLIDDPGRPGRRSRGAEKGPYKDDPKWIQRKGKLGGPGYTKRSSRDRHAILNKCVKEYGYRSCLGSLQVLLRNSEISAKVRKTIESDIAWLKKKHGASKKRKSNAMHRDAGLETYSVEELEAMPTIDSSQDADLKVDTPTHRWWLSRMGPDDGETHQVHVEEYVDSDRGSYWSHIHSYAPFVYSVDEYGQPRTVRRLKNDLKSF
jgi:hypothetical protein